MPKKYVVYRPGYIMVGGQSTEIKVGQSVKKTIFDNYPNFVAEIDTDPVVPHIESTKPIVGSVEETPTVPASTTEPELPETEIVGSVEETTGAVDFEQPAEPVVEPTVEPVTDDSDEEIEPTEETPADGKKRGGRKSKTA